VAIKQLVSVPPGEWPRQVARIRVVGAVAHPNLGRHLDAFVGPYPFDDDEPPADEFDLCYTVMAWVDGRDLGDAVDGVDLPTVFGWVRDVARAAGALHRRATPTGVGIVHRDNKPSNVRVVTPTGEAVLIDFGIARPLDGATMTRSAGAPGWMPPEAFEDPRAVGPRSDTWQVGGLAAWAVLGTPPGALVPEDRRSRLTAALRQQGVGAAEPVARHIDRALSARTGDRPPDVERWGDELVRLAGRRRPLLSRRRLAAAALAVLVVAVLVVAAGGLGRAVWDTGSEDGPATDDGTTPATVEAAPSIGRVAIDPASPAPLDLGQSVAVTITYTHPVPAGRQILVVPRASGKPAAGATWMAAPMAGLDQRFTFTVPATRAPGAVVVDQLLLWTRVIDDPSTVTAEGGGDEQVVPVRLTFAPALRAPERCTAYNPATVTTTAAGNRWRVSSGGTVIAEMISRTDASQVAAVAAQADQVCLIGDATPPNAPMQYWRRGGRLVTTAETTPELSNADCFGYDPTTVRTERTALVAGGTSLASFLTAAEAETAADLARHYHRQCVIGRHTQPNEVGPTVTYWQ
jgi:hypothetical protein